MLTIKDLPAAKALDRTEMAAVCGGKNQTSIGDFNQYADQSGKHNVNTNVGVFAPEVSNIDVSNVGNSTSTSFGKHRSMKF
jgi:hypothetical protein